MGQTNSKRVSHIIEDQPNVFRGDELQQIINDLGEEDTGKGYSELTYLVGTPFVSNITTYTDATKTVKRTSVDLTYAPVPFVTQIVKEIFDEDDDGITVASITAVVTYNANKTVNNVDVTTSRP